MLNAIKKGGEELIKYIVRKRTTDEVVGWVEADNLNDAYSIIQKGLDNADKVMLETVFWLEDVDERRHSDKWKK